MRLKSLKPELSLTIIPMAVTEAVNVETGRTAYVIGAIIALLILAYLAYSLFKPDKF